MGPDERQLGLPIWDEGLARVAEGPEEVAQRSGEVAESSDEVAERSEKVGSLEGAGEPEGAGEGREDTPRRAAGESLEALRNECLACARCDLRRGCTQVVFGEGDPHARLMLVGEGPGEQEDIQGRPFVGAAGHLLDRILASIGLRREDVYIANIVKCRPPGNRLPTAEEAASCLPHLLAQIRAVKPRIIVCLGALATQMLIDKNARITRMRGTWFERDGVLYMPTFHPAALLRDETKKRPVWEDMKKVREALDKLGPT